MNVVEIMSRSLNNPFAQKFLNTFFKGNEMTEPSIYTYVIVRTDMPDLSDVFPEPEFGYG